MEQTMTFADQLRARSIALQDTQQKAIDRIIKLFDEKFPIEILVNIPEPALLRREYLISFSANLCNYFVSIQTDYKTSLDVLLTKEEYNLLYFSNTDIREIISQHIQDILNKNGLNIIKVHYGYDGSGTIKVNW